VVEWHLSRKSSSNSLMTTSLAMQTVDSYISTIWSNFAL
jgi:hypothetical protein